ncbi:MAG: DUF433 domain-containing protein [Bryobacterales bacterium]|nr:DUF433 domain-containing protein [Bryobacterales bacterium]
MRLRERIVMDPEILAGKPVIRGTRLSVELMLELMEAGQTDEELLYSYPGIVREDLAACREWGPVGGEEA